MRILHTADWHVRDKNIEEIEGCLRFLCKKAQGADLVVIAGDIFDSRDIKLDSKSAKLVIKTVSELADICPVAIVTGTPSHDGSAPEILRYARGKFDVHVSSYPEQVRLIDGYLYDREAGDGSEIVEALVTLIPQPTKQFFGSSEDIQTSNEQISQALSGLFAGFGAAASEYKCPHLLVYHGSISGAKLSNAQILTGMDIEVSTDQLKLSNADLFLCGHIHLPQELPGNVFYSGSIYPNNFGENHEHGFYIHEFDCDELYKSEFVKTPCRKLVRFAVDLTTENIEYLDNFIIHHASTTDIKESYVRVDITTWQDEASKINKENITRQYLSYGAKDVDIRIIRVPRQNVRSETVLKVETLRDKLVAMAALNNETVPERILAKADALESTPAEDIIVRAA